MEQNNTEPISNDQTKRLKLSTLVLIIAAGLCLLAGVAAAVWLLITTLKPTPQVEMSKEDQEKICFDPDLVRNETQRIFRRVILRAGACYESLIPDGRLRYKLPEYDFFATISDTESLRLADAGDSARIEQAFKDEGFEVAKYDAETYPVAETLINFARDGVVCDYWLHDDGYATVDCAEQDRLSALSAQLKTFHDIAPSRVYDGLQISEYQSDSALYQNAKVDGVNDQYQLFFGKDNVWQLILSDTSRVKGIVNCPPNEKQYYNQLWVLNTATDSGNNYCAETSGNLVRISDYWDKKFSGR
jgi:hypothetical protein